MDNKLASLALWIDDTTILVHIEVITNINTVWSATCMQLQSHHNKVLLRGARCAKAELVVVLLQHLELVRWCAIDLCRDASLQTSPRSFLLLQPRSNLLMASIVYCSFIHERVLFRLVCSCCQFSLFGKNTFEKLIRTGIALGL